MNSAAAHHTMTSLFVAYQTLLSIQASGFLATLVRIQTENVYEEWRQSVTFRRLVNSAKANLRREIVQNQEALELARKTLYGGYSVAGL